jgi:hypothetical protein
VYINKYKSYLLWGVMDEEVKPVTSIQLEQETQQNPAYIFQKTLKSVTSRYGKERGQQFHGIHWDYIVNLIEDVVFGGGDSDSEISIAGKETIYNGLEKNNGKDIEQLRRILNKKNLLACDQKDVEFFYSFLQRIEQWLEEGCSSQQGASVDAGDLSSMDFEGSPHAKKAVNKRGPRLR